MWDTVPTNDSHLSHDMPCTECGHAQHSYLPCSDTCACDCTPPTSAARTASAAGSAPAPERRVELSAR